MANTRLWTTQESRKWKSAGLEAEEEKLAAGGRMKSRKGWTETPE